ncbi:MAG: hypothetical protein ACR2KE_08675 [Candidatus Nanopelagicales bacterium]
MTWTPDRRRLPLVLTASLLLAFIGSMLMGAIPAHAQSCAEATQSDHDTLIKADNTSTNASGWNCAYVFTTGDDEIALAATEIQESVTGYGYQKVFDCKYQTGSVTIVGPTVVDGGGTVPSSATWSATNLATGSRHYVVAALWNTTKNSRYPYAGQYNNDSNCTNYDIPFNEVYTTSIDWSFTGAANGQVPVNYPWPFKVTLKPIDGKVISDDTVYMKVSFRDDTTSDDTIVGAGILNNNVATVNIVMPQAGTFKLWPVYPGIAYKKVTPPSTGTTPVDGSCLGGTNCPDGNVVRPVTFAKNPSYTPTLTMTMPSTAPGSTSADAQMTLTIPSGAGSLTVQPPGVLATITIHQAVDDTPNPSTDPTFYTGNFNSVAPGTYNMSEYFKLPSTPGNYRYYANFSGYAAIPNASAYNGVNPVNSTPVTVAVTSLPTACSTLTGGTTNTYIKANNSYTDSRGYNCAYLDDTGPILIAARQTAVIKFTSASQYQAVASCETPTSSQAAVIVSAGPVDGGGTSPSKVYWQITNNSSSSSTADLKAYGSVLWMVRTNSTTPYANQYNGTNCDSTIANKPLVIAANLLHMMTATLGKPTGTVAQGATSTWPVTLSSIDKYVVNGATVTIMQMQGSVPSSADDTVGTGTITSNSATVSVKPQAGPLNFYAVLVGSNYINPPLPSVGWTAAQSSPVNSSGGAVSASAGQSAAKRAVNVVTPAFTPLPSPRTLDSIDVARHAEAQHAYETRLRTSILRSLLPTQVYVVETSGKKNLSASCPTGTGLYTFATSAPHASYGPGDYALSPNGRGISLKAKGSVPTRMQVTCRPVGSPMAIRGTLGRGSVKADRMVATLAGSIFTGGPGGDTMTSKGMRTALDGGLGADSLTVRGPGSSANGGFGRDYLVADADGVLLYGAQGRDTFRTGDAKVLVNARDGRGGDTVICGSSATRVAADPGDVIQGPCTLLR